jgi:hypothetical protein
VRRAALVLAVAALAGCGDRTAITTGGRVPGEILTVYVLAPRTDEGTDLVRGAKLALAQAGGRVGKLTVQFASADEPGGEEPLATAVRDLVRDTGTIAVIDAHANAVTVPLLNAVGLLHVSPVSPQPFAQPSPDRTFFAFGATPEQMAAAIRRDTRGPYAVEFAPDGEALADAMRPTVPARRARTIVYAGPDRPVARSLLRENPRALVVVRDRAAAPHAPRVRVVEADGAPPPGFAEAFGGAEAGPLARAGFDAMNAVLAALRGAGKRAQNRQAVIDAFTPPDAAALRLTT